MQAIPDDPATYDAARLLVARTQLPANLRVHEELGKGTNNRVYRATLDGHECVLRAPRRRSDTQQRGSALWEFRHTLKAGQLGVGPAVYQAWCARHATDRWPSGLYVVTERLEHDLETVLCEDAAQRARALERRDALADALVRCVETLAREHIFVYDLKPSNVVVSLDDDGGVAAKLIDFGRDFCEWAGCDDDPDSNTPCVTMLRKRVRARERAATDAEVDALVSHVLFATMMVLLAATTTRNLFEDRADHRMDGAERAAVNPVVERTTALLASMQGRNLALVREVLRMDDVRGVLRHYHGRRDAGTHRTLALALGKEF